MTSGGWRSIRVRIAAGYVGSLLLLVTVFCASLVALMYFRGLADLDKELQGSLAHYVDMQALGEQVPGLADPAGAFEIGESGQPTIDAWLPRSSLEAPSRRVVRIRGQNTAPVSWPDSAAPAFGEGLTVKADGRRWRTMLAAASTARPGVQPAHIVFQASLPLDHLEQSVSLFLGYAAWCLLGLSVIGFSGGFWMAARALAPMLRVIQQTQAIKPGAVSDRLPIPAVPDEVADLVHVINDLLMRTEAALRKEASFATEAAHELRTPLTAQRSVGELALRSPKDADRLWDAITEMLEECEHMELLIDGLLLVARGDGGLLATTHRSIDAASMAAGCARAMLPVAELKSQHITTRGTDGVKIVADETLVRQALLNLLQNAVDHTPAGTVIEVRVTRSTDAAEISVQDNGPGMAHYDASQIVRRSLRRTETPPARQGLGLGLSIARSLVKSQGGSMLVQSSPDSGTCVTLQFPLQA